MPNRPIASQARTRKDAPSGPEAKSVALLATSGAPAQVTYFEAFRTMTPAARAREIRQGFEAGIVSRLADELLHVPLQSLLKGLRLPASTIKRKLGSGERLSPGESDRLARALQVFFAATEVFEDPLCAARWICAEHAELAGERPLDVLDTQAGYDRVQDLLLRLEYGVGV